MADSEQYRPAWPAVGAGVKRRCGWRVARAATCTLLLALSAALPGCSQTATLPTPEASSDQDDFDRVVERLRQIIDETSPAAAVPDGTQPSQRQVSASAITPAADGKPASATITILTLPAHVVEDAAAFAEGDLTIAPEDDQPETDATAAEEGEEVTYHLVYGKTGWQLADEPAEEFERLWFEYALR